MKDTNKIRGLYIALLIVICVGGVFAGIRKNILHGWLNFSGKNKNAVSDEFVFDYADVDSITIKADVASLEIKEGSELKVEYKYTKGYEPEVNIKGSDLEIIQSEESKSVENIDCKLTITIPKKAEFDIIDAKVSLGSFEIKEVAASKLNIIADLGSVNIKNSDFAEIDINASLGSVDIHNIKSEDITVDASLGSVNVSGEFDSLDVDASLGSITVKTDKPENEVKLKLNADLGSVNVNGKERK